MNTHDWKCVRIDPTGSHSVDYIYRCRNCGIKLVSNTANRTELPVGFCNETPKERTTPMDKTETGPGSFDIHAEHSMMVLKLLKPGEAILAQMTPLKASLGHIALGIATEACELADAIKKHYAYGKELDMVNIVEEYGDLEFFLCALRQELGISRPEVLHKNYTKLMAGPKARYPDGYSDAAAIARADKQETVSPEPTFCSICGSPQFETLSGITCANGHGGAEPLQQEGA